MTEKQKKPREWVGFATLIFIGFLWYCGWELRKEERAKAHATVETVSLETKTEPEKVNMESATAEPVVSEVISQISTNQNRVWTFNVRVAGIKYKPARE